MPDGFADRCRNLSDLLGDAPCGVVASEEDRGIVFVNQRILDWVQRSEGEIVGHTFAEVLLAPELADAITPEVELIKHGDHRLRMVVMQRRDSSTFPALLVPHVVQEPGRSGWAIVLVLDLGAIQTAKPVRNARSNGLRDRLDRIALELQTLALTAAPSATALHHPDFTPLSARERQIVALLLDGRRVPGIAEELDLSPHTVRNHLKSVFDKLGVHSQAELIERARSLER